MAAMSVAIGSMRPPWGRRRAGPGHRSALRRQSGVSPSCPRLPYNIRHPVALYPWHETGVYEIVGALGAGGMGEVYRATDTRLKRAGRYIDLPHAPSAAEHRRLARLQREAEVLASLNDRHIAAIYGLEEADGVKALVMELVEGHRALRRPHRAGADPGRRDAPDCEADCRGARSRARAKDHPPRSPAVEYQATTRRHGEGVGLRPGEGLGARAGENREDVTASRTFTSPAMTEIGVVLGTAAYMSPEYTRTAGGPPNGQMGFGCVLSEMLTGSQAFRGRTVTDVLAAVIGAEPEWQRLPAATPPWLRSLLRRRLEQDRGAGARHRRHSDRTAGPARRRRAAGWQSTAADAEGAGDLPWGLTGARRLV